MSIIPPPEKINLSFRVMGSRLQNDSGNSSGRLTAWDTKNSIPVPIEAEWQYEGEDIIQYGSEFVDTKPQSLIKVRVRTERTIINRRNICGTIETMLALRDDQSVVAWSEVIPGDTLFGRPPIEAIIPTDIQAMTDIIGIWPGENHFAVLRKSGNVSGWGGINIPTSITVLNDIIDVVPCFSGYNVLRQGGFGAGWASSERYVIPADIATKGNIIKIGGDYSEGRSGSAILNDHSITSWPLNTPSDVQNLKDIVYSQGNGNGITVIRELEGKRKIQFFGYEFSEPLPETIELLEDVKSVKVTTYAQAALRMNGSVVCWGDLNHGGSLPDDIAKLDDIVAVVNNDFCFAALRSNGAVVAWGPENSGGDVPEEIRNLSDIIDITASADVFTALRIDGSVVCWGNRYNSDIEKVKDDLINIRAVYAGTFSMAAIREDGRVITWGGRAGNSSQFTDEIDYKVSYEFPQSM